MNRPFNLKRDFLITLLFLATSWQTTAAGTILAVTGDVPKPLSYSLGELQKLPVTKITARDHNGETANYIGVTLEEILRRSYVPLGEKLRGPALTKVVVVHAADHYAAAFSVAELDSAMSDHATLLCWSRNDEALAAGQGPLKLVVPGDKRQARWVRQVISLEVVNLVAGTNTMATPEKTEKR